MASIGKVSAVFTASTSGLTAGVKAAGSAFRSLQSDAKGLQSAMNSLVAIQGAQLFGNIVSSATSTIKSYLGMADAQARVIDSTSKLSSRLGMTYGELAGISLAAEESGVSMEMVGAGATKAEIAFAKAAAGSQAASAAFDRIGLSVQNLNGLSAAERFQAIAVAIAKIPTESQRSTAAVGIFGKAGAQLLPLFAGGAAGITKSREEAEKLGLALKTAQGQDVVEMFNQFSKVSKVVDGIVQQVVAYLAPAVTEVAKTLNELALSAGAVTIGQAIGEGILAGARVLAQIGDYLVQNLSSVWKYIEGVGAGWAQTTVSMQQVAAVFSAAFNGAGAAFLMIIRGATAPFSTIIEQLAGLLSYLPGAVGEFASQVAASQKGFRDGLDASITTQVEKLKANLDFATQISQKPVAQAISGPLVTAVDAAAARARETANSIDVASKTPIELKQEVVVDVAQAIKGIDSRSTEGITEMFRIMRGGAGDVQEQQLSVLQEIAANTGEEAFSVADIN